MASVNTTIYKVMDLSRALGAARSQEMQQATSTTLELDEKCAKMYLYESTYHPTYSRNLLPYASPHAAAPTPSPSAALSPPTPLRISPAPAWAASCPRRLLSACRATRQRWQSILHNHNRAPRHKTVLRRKPALSQMHCPPIPLLSKRQRQRRAA
jgi:hypothetical protein